MKSTVLITGVAGFIGSNLCAALLAKGHRIIGVDNLSQGLLRNIAEFRSNPLFEFHQLDVRDRTKIASLVKQADCVAHLAAFKIPRYGNAADTLDVNTHGTRSILDAAKGRGCKVVVTSTSDVYGRNPNVPFSETSDLWMGATSVKRWSYAVSKMYDEHLCFAYAEEFNVPIVIVRLFGGYGPHQNLTWWGGPQSVFIGAALRGEPMEIHGDGCQTRSFTFTTDHIDGLIRCIEMDQAVGQVFNLGNIEEIRIIDLAALIWQLAGRGSPQYKMISYRTFGKYEDVARRVPNITLASSRLGFEPKVSLREGLPITIDWQRQVMAETAKP